MVPQIKTFSQNLETGKLGKDLDPQLAGIKPPVASGSSYILTDRLLRLGRKFYSPTILMWHVQETKHKPI